ncbi:MAG: hypothetical protein JNN11_05500 [Candidatus Doudnabacteria bacterium]|nr:hypothetical protein [Candidatus Doudnabacteria bacterium]
MSLLKEKLELKVEEAEYNAQQALGGFLGWQKILLLSLLVLVLPIYFVTKSISRGYWQNKLKPEIISAKPSFQNPEPLQIGQVRLVNYPDQTSGAVVEISNQNKDIAAGILKYNWTYYNSNGQVLTPLNSEALGGETFVLPSTKKYLLVPKANTTEPISRAEISLGETVWQKRANLPTVILRPSPLVTSQIVSPITFSAEGSILNNSSFKIKQVRLYLFIYDVAGKLSAISQRTENDLAPGERRAYKQIWPNLYMQGAKGEVFAETNILDPLNLQTIEVKNNSSDLSRPIDDPRW